MGAYSGSLYQALACSKEGNSNRIMTLGRARCPSRRSIADPAPASTFPPCFCTKAPAFGPYSCCQFVFFTSSCATIYAARGLSFCHAQQQVNPHASLITHGGGKSPRRERRQANLYHP